MADNYIKQIKVGTTNYDIDAKKWDGHLWSDIGAAIKFIGEAETSAPSAGNYVKAIVDDATYYISITSSGTATEIAAEKGYVFIVASTSREYLCTTAGLSTASEWTILGDENLYAKKSVAGKAGTYTSSAASTTTSGSAGAQTASGSATITYSKAATVTGEAGAATITSAEGGAVSIAYTPKGSISGSQSISAHSHGVNLTKATVNYISDVDSATGSAGAHTHSVSGNVTAAGTIATGTGTVNYTPAGTIDVAVNAHTYTPEGTVSKPAISLTSSSKNFNTDAIKAVDSTFSGAAATITATGSYTPEGTISAISHASHTHTVEVNTNTVQPVISVNANTGNAGAHSHTVDSHTHADAVTAVSGYPNFSGGSLGGTKTFNTDAIKEISLAASTTSTDGPAYVESVTHTAASLSGQTTFVTSISGFSGGSFTQGTDSFTANVPTAIDVTKFNSGTQASYTQGTFSQGTLPTYKQGSKASFTQGAKASLSYTARADVMCTPTVSDGILSWSTTTCDDITGWTTNGSDSFTANGDDTFTQGSLPTHAADSFTKNTVASLGTGFYTAGSAASFTQGTDSHTAASLGTQNKGTVGISGGSITPVTKYMSHSTTAASKATVTFTAAALGTASTVSAAGAASAATLTSSEVAAHSHSVTSSKTSATLTYVTGIKSVSSAGAYSVTPTFTGTAATLSVSADYTPEGTISNTYTAASTAAVNHVTAAALASTPTFTGTKATLSHTVGTKTFTGTGVQLVFNGSQVSLNNGSAASAGAHTHSIDVTAATLDNVTAATLNTAGAATVDFSKASFTGTAATLSQAAHTHSVTVSAHTHSISLSNATVTGTAAVAVSNHTHSIGHTHTVTIPNCAD